MPKTMKAMQIARPGGDFELVERPLPTPAEAEVRIRVQACGICHSDLFVKEGLFPGIAYPRIPGHEVVGVIDALGPGVTSWQPGQRVGVGWHGGHCHTCEACREGDFVNCVEAKITGISFDGGYAEYMVAPAESLARVPDTLDSVEAAPLLCAGITTYNALRNSGARPGDLVAVQGIGGLGHLGVQFAHHMGFLTVALSRGADKEALARELGADHYIDTASGDGVAALQALGGARVILATAPNSRLITALFSGLSRHGRMIVVGIDNEPIEVTPLQLIAGNHSLTGWASGHARDSEDTLRFSALRGVNAMIETYPLEQAKAAYERMLNNEARFRVVLSMNPTSN
ncbi:alcohol dehydrogenase [Acidihalobacter yilgarnensis]|uniref:Alcohol dehydrogenase n=1 Tax=Acidihalobacter yilgarnensis TaxID=2819280 RepID=A0A1D8IMH2_9GAMM|nr:alcohol dehydrogenase [Acidihalobacter yilgarnensis]AOU97673.1 alcohol dehydrogenase [Acidihalobacter yilgarnensis]